MTSQPDESTGFLGKSTQFSIYFLRCTHVSTSSEIMDLRMEKEVSLEVVFIGYHRSKNILGCKIVYDSEWIMRPNKSFINYWYKQLSVKNAPNG